jgi:pimeloyl-ACP methyl ester carboxylesterase
MATSWTSERPECRYRDDVLLVRTNGLEVARVRRGDGPPLVLVHGAAEDHRSWRFQLDDLAEVATVVAWDEPGCGRSSDPPADLDLRGLARALAAVVETVGPAHVLGFSWGGTIVLELWRQRPDLVASLVLADTYAGWRGSLPAEEVEARVAAVTAALDAEDPDLSVPGLFAGPPAAEAVALLAEMAADVRPATLRRSLALMATADLSDVLPTIDVPTLLLWGEHDVRSPLSVAHAFEAAIPGARLEVLPGVGHAAHLESPAPFTAAVRDWVTAQSARD